MPKEKKPWRTGKFGLSELEKFLKANPGVTKETLGQLKSWTVNILGLQDTVKKDIGLRLDQLGTAIQQKKSVISAQEAIIAAAKKEIASADTEIQTAQAGITRAKEIADLFGA